MYGVFSPSAKLLATTMYFLKGTPFIYQGQEIGMTNYEVDSIYDFIDIGLTILFFQRLFRAGQRTGNVDHCQQSKNIRLDKAREQIKVAAKHSRNTVS